MTSAADRIGAGLAAARPARPIRPGERIHVVGAAGAGASAAALLAARAGAVVTGCDPGGPSPYTPALEALGIDVAGAHAASHVTIAPRPDRLAVTKALTAVDPDHPELVAARTAGHPARAVAAGRRRRGGRAGPSSASPGRTARARRPAGSSTCSSRPAGSVGVRRGAPAGRADRRTAGHGPGRAGERVRRRGRRVRRQLRRLPAGHRRRDGGRMGPPRRLRRPGGGHRRVRGLAAADGRRVDPGRQHRRPGRRGRRRSPAGALDRRSWRMPLVDASPGRGGYLRGIGERYATAAGPAGAAARPDRHAPTPAGRPSRSTGWTRSPARPRSASPPPAATTPRTRSPSPAPRSASAWHRSAIAAGLASFGGVGRRLERKGEAAGVVVYDDYGHHPTAIAATLAAVRQREPGRRVWAVYEPLTYHRTAAMLGCLRGGPGRGGRGRRRRHLGRPRPGHDERLGRRPGRGGQIGPAGHHGPRPGLGRGHGGCAGREVRPGDAVLVMGGGASYRIGERLLERLEADG